MHTQTMLGLGPEEDKLENGGHGGFLESFKVNPSRLTMHLGLAKHISMKDAGEQFWGMRGVP